MNIQSQTKSKTKEAAVARTIDLAQSSVRELNQMLHSLAPGGARRRCCGFSIRAARMRWRWGSTPR